MALDFKKLGEVSTVDKVLDGDTLLVARDGGIYRVNAGSVGGVGGYLLAPAESEVSFDSDTGGITITSAVDDMIAAYKAGAHVVIHLPASVVNTILGSAIPIDATMLVLAEAEGTIMGAILLVETMCLIVFTNGGE